MTKKAILILLSFLSHQINAQKVGIGTQSPAAALDIISPGNSSSTKALDIKNSSGTKILTALDNGSVGIGTNAPHSSSILDLIATDRALILPRVADTTAIVAPTDGMMIYDISAACIKSYEDGAWSPCLSGKNQQSSTVIADCSSTGFQGTYINGAPMAASNKFSVTIVNNSFSTANIPFSTSDLVLSGISGVSVASVSPSSIALSSGQSQIVEYTLSGTPTSTGVLTGTWSKVALNCLKTVAVIPPSITSLDCAGATQNGTLIQNVSASGVSSVISYTGGNGSAHSGQTVTSTGVTGLTATLSAGSFANGSGTLTYTITGTPSSTGTASFAINIGGRTCTLNRTVVSPTSIVSCSQASGGSMMLNTAYTAGSVTQTIRLSVTVSGNYTFTTNTVGGITFSKSGTYSGTGTQDIVLVATGTPNTSGNLTFTATLSDATGTVNCTFTRYVQPTTVNIGLSSIASNGCNSGAQGPNDLRTFGWQDTGSSFTLNGGNYSMSYNANITANGKVYSGTPNKPLEGLVLYRLRNTSTGVTYLASSGSRTTYSSCQNRGVGDHSASGSYSGSASTQTLPTGTYILQAYGESYMGGCGSMGSDYWAGCGLAVNGGTLTLTGQ